MEYLYGLKARPLGADMALASIKKKDVLSYDEVSDELTTLLGSGVRHGLIVTDYKLEDEFVANHELVDVQAVLNSNYNRAKKVIKYLVKKGKRELYLTKGFYTQIEMSEDEFIELCCDYGFESEDEFYESIELSYRECEAV